MIARLFLLFVALLIGFSAIQDFRILLEHSDGPSSVSVAALVPGADIPLYVQVRDASPVMDSVCETTTYEDNGVEIPISELLVPLISAEAEEKSSKSSMSVTAFYAVDGCNRDPDFTRLIGTAQTESLSEEVRKTFETMGFSSSERSVVIRQVLELPTALASALWFLVSIIFAAAAILPFLARDRWPKYDKLTDYSTEDALAAMYPAIKLYDEGRHDAVGDLIAGLSCTTTEVVVLRANCRDSANRACHALFTNRRYILYRMRKGWLARLLGFVSVIVDKIPVVGGFLVLMSEPFVDLYEMLFDPKLASYRVAMGYSDQELLTGKVSWRCVADFPWGEVATRSSEVRFRPSFWSGGIKVEFMPRTISHTFRLPPDFRIEERGTSIPLNRLVQAAAAWLERVGCRVQSKNGSSDVELPPLQPTATV